jgi:recombinational DNA repair ATPase RecF
MKLTQLAVDNFLRISVAVIDFDPDKAGTVALMGENEQGKSSALNAFETLLAGRKTPKYARPVHDGADQASILATFRDDDGTVLTVRRVYKTDGTTRIEVKQDGLKVARPDDILRRLYSHVALDPLAFANSSAGEQAATLIGFLDFDPTELDKKRANLFATRTDVGYPPAAEVGDRIDVAATARELDSVVAQQRDAEALEAAVATAVMRHAECTAQVEHARAALAEAEGELANWTSTLASRREAADAAVQTVPDPAPLRERIASAEQHNAAIDEQFRRQKVEAELGDAKNRELMLTKSIKEVDAAKAAAFAEATMPVPGLTIEDGEVYLDGTPFSQTSSGGKLRTSVAIAMALNPELRAIVVRDGSLLDKGNRAIIDQLARDNDFAVLMEIVDDAAASGVVFEDGQIAEVRP